MLTGLYKLTGRSNAFTFVFYPQGEFDSDYLFTFLWNCNVPSIVSPCHDQDIDHVDPSTGEITYKDTHYHVALDFGSGANIAPKPAFFSSSVNGITLIEFNLSDCLLNLSLMF